MKPADSGRARRSRDRARWRARALAEDDRQQLVVAERRGAHALQLLARSIVRRDGLHRTPYLLYFRPNASRCCPSVSTLSSPQAAPNHHKKKSIRAQGAIDTARAAGAEQYAAAEFAAATSALQKAHDAVNQRDFRLALSRALDASQRAQESARLAADGQARARSDAEVAVHGMETALQQLETKLKVATTARTPEPELKSARQALINGQRNLQKARSVLAGGKYLEARAVVKEAVDEINGQMRAIDDAAGARTSKRRR